MHDLSRAYGAGDFLLQNCLFTSVALYSNEKAGYAHARTQLGGLSNGLFGTEVEPVGGKHSADEHRRPSAHV